MRQWMSDFPLVILRAFPVEPDSLLRLASEFGRPLEKAGVKPIIRLIPDVTHTDRTETFSSVTAMEWHADRSFDVDMPTWSFLYAESVGPGAGQTLWANTALAFDHLPDPMKQECLHLKAVHSLEHFSQTYDDEIYRFSSPEQQKKVFAQAKTEKNLVEKWNGRPYLNINRGYTASIPGKDRGFLDKLLGYCEDESVRYTHAWRRHDLVISNNRVLIHARQKSTGNDRTMYRVLIS